VYRLLLFLLFFPRATPASYPLKSTSQASYRTAILVSVICILHAGVVFVISLTIIYLRSAYLRSWAEIIGILGTILAAIQFLPQIWTTWSLQEVGSLSIPMMCIQTPGSFVWVGSLAARFGWEGWSTWGIYLVTGLLQGCLLGMGFAFELRAGRKRNSEEVEENIDGTTSEPQDEDTDNERTRLISNGR